MNKQSVYKTYTKADVWIFLLYTEQRFIIILGRGKYIMNYDILVTGMTTAVTRTYESAMKKLGLHLEASMLRSHECFHHTIILLAGFVT